MASTITFCAAPSASVTIVPSTFDRYIILLLSLVVVVVVARLFLQLLSSPLLFTDTTDAHIIDEVDEEQHDEQDHDKERPVASIAIRRIGSDATMDEARHDVANENKSMVSAFFVSLPLLFVIVLLLLLL